MIGVILLPFWLRLMVPSLKITPQIFPEILLNKYLRIFNESTTWRHHVANLHNTKTSISPKRKKIFQKRKRHWTLHWKAFQISNKNFSCHVHFKLKSQHHPRCFVHRGTFFIYEKLYSANWEIQSAVFQVFTFMPRRSFQESKSSGPPELQWYSGIYNKQNNQKWFTSVLGWQQEHMTNKGWKNLNNELKT